MANRGPWERQLRWGVLGLFSLIGLNILLLFPPLFTGPVGWGVGQMVWRQGLPHPKLASADVMALHTGLLAALFSAVVQGPGAFPIYPTSVVVPVPVVVVCGGRDSLDRDRCGLSGIAAGGALPLLARNAGRA